MKSVADTMTLTRTGEFQVRPRVLVVDDDQTTRILVRATLEQADFEIEEVSCGADALERAREVAYDLVLLDLLMPGLDGFSTCKALRAIPHLSRTPVMIMTGLEDMASVKQAFDAGATDFVTKPLNFELLMQRVRFVLRAKATLNQLYDSQARLRDAHRIAGLGDWEWTVGGEDVSLSPQLCLLFQIPTNMRFGSFSDFVRFIHPDDVEALRSKVVNLVDGKEEFSVEHRIVSGDGEVRTVHHEARFLAGRSGARDRVLGIVQDITHLRSAEQLATYAHYHDRLTGLANRVGLQERINALANRVRKIGMPFMLVAIDLDHFHRINDSLGQGIGDGLLQEVGRRLVSMTKRLFDDGVLNTSGLEAEGVAETGEFDPMDPGAFVSRPGADEFVLVLPLSGDAASEDIIIGEIQDWTEATYQIEGDEYLITSSIGIVKYPQHGNDAKQLLKNVLVAANEAQRRGGQRVVLFDQHMSKDIAKQLTIEGKLRAGLKRGEVTIAYQPRVSALDGSLLGMEALARWENDELGMVSPTEFIPIAERHGLIDTLGSHVLDGALACASRLRHTLRQPAQVSVNLSARQLANPGLVPMILDALERHRLGSELLEIEVTESVLIDDFEHSISVLGELMRRGVSIALDDFGTGYASLNYLRHLPLSTVKVDRTFVQELRETGTSHFILQAIVQLAHSLGMRVVMEGIETPTQLEIVRRIGVDEIQGWLVSHAVSESSLQDWDRNWAGFAPLSEDLVDRGRLELIAQDRFPIARLTETHREAQLISWQDGSGAGIACDEQGRSVGSSRA